MPAMYTPLTAFKNTKTPPATSDVSSSIPRAISNLSSPNKTSPKSHPLNNPSSTQNALSSATVKNAAASKQSSRTPLSRNPSISSTWSPSPGS